MTDTSDAAVERLIDCLQTVHGGFSSGAVEREVLCIAQEKLRALASERAEWRAKAESEGDVIFALRSEVASLRLTLGGRTYSATAPEPIGCPAPGACVQVAEIATLRAERDAAVAIKHDAIRFQDRFAAERDAARAEAQALREALHVARGRIVDERRDLVECDTIPDANEWRDESAMGVLTKEAVAEIDRDLAVIDAALAAAQEATHAAE